MKTVGYITASVDQRVGIGRYSHEVIKHAAAHGHTARVLTYCNDTDDDELSRTERVEVQKLLPGKRQLSGLWHNVRWGKRAASALAGCDLVHTLFDFPHTELGARVARRLDVPLVVTALGSNCINPLYRRPHGGRLAVAMLEAYRVIAASRFILDEIEQRLQLPNGVVIPLGTTPPDGIPVGSRDDTAPFRKLDPFTVLGVGPVDDERIPWSEIVDQILTNYPADEPRRPPTDARTPFLGRW